MTIKPLSRKLFIMYYNYDFDITAVLILIVILVFTYQKRSVPLLQNKIFKIICWLVLINTITDFTSSYLNQNHAFYTPSYRFLLFLISGIMFSSAAILPLLYLIYCMSISDIFENKTLITRKRLTGICFIPCALNLLFIFLTVVSLGKITPVFHINELGFYSRGKIFNTLMYINAALYYLSASILLAVKSKSITSRQYWLISSFVLFTVTCVIIQWLNQKLLVQCFGMTLSLLLFSYTVQRPEDRLDPVTEAFNAQAFALVTEKYFRIKKTFYCAGITIDNMEYMINTFGIQRFNNMLKIASKYLVTVSKKAHAYHLSQGRFCLVFKDTDYITAQRVLSDILTHFQTNIEEGKTNFKLNIKTCLIACPDDAETTEDIIDFINMVAEENRFRKGGLVHARKIDKGFKKRSIQIDYILRNAFRQKALEIYYQPIYSTKKKRMIGAEALIRLRDIDNVLGNGKGAFISPEEFIPIAERNGSIYSIGEFVIEQVCQMIHLNQPLERYGIEKIDINLSVIQCMQETITDQIINIINIYNIPKNIINLEITETAAAYNQESLVATMNKLRDEGIEFSLDDYGSGYATMEYMLDMPFQIIKIDKGLVWNAFANPRTNVALASTISMISDLGFEVLAEGVETQEQADWLASLGCDYLQGYLFSKPMPENNFLSLFLQANKDVYDSISRRLSSL